MSTDGSRLEILHEHPTWFKPLFAELARRAIPFERKGVDDLEFGVTTPTESAGSRVLFNRISPSAYLREGATAIRFTLHYLEELEAAGVRVVNGSHAHRVEISKLHQLRILRSRGLRAPVTRAAHTREGGRAAAERIGFPLILKPNVGGSGAGVVRVDEPSELEAALDHLLTREARSVDPTFLVQEFTPPAGESIVRVEVVGGRFLYAIRIHLTGETFNLCPADVCRSVDGEELTRTACPADAPETGLTVEAFEPEVEVIREVEGLMAAAGIEVGGVEYLDHAETGERVYYDVNALSNFVADPLRVLGFDPTARLVDWLEEQVIAGDRGVRRELAGVSR